MAKRIALVSGATGIATFAGYAAAAGNWVEISERGNQICIRSNNVPNHAMGQFPNRGNPHSMRAQKINVIAGDGALREEQGCDWGLSPPSLHTQSAA